MQFRTWAGVVLMTIATSTFAEPPPVVRLPPPQIEGGKPLMQALKERHSTREFSPEVLSPQVLSNLLWAAAGVNRPATGQRTVPSARDWREIDVYVARADGMYRYDAKANALQPVVARDLRALTGVQDFVAMAPVNLVYVADFDRMEGAAAEQKEFYAAADAGFIAQNVYLFCASANLATVVRGSVNRDTLAKAMGLAPHQRIVLAQTVGYPAKKR